MGRKIYYGEQGEIERISYREGCRWKVGEKCWDNSNLEGLGKVCHKGEECRKWEEDRKWKGKKR